MAEYIRREDAIKAIEEMPNCYNGFSDTYDKAQIIGELEEIPSADVAPVKHGMNIEQEYNPVDRFMCSECEIILEGYREVRIDEDDGDETYHEFAIRFCPNCGARLDGE